MNDRFPAPPPDCLVPPGLILAVCLAIGFAVCSTPTPPPEDDLDPSAGLTVLYIGNSLTGSNDLPALVQGIAEAGGRSLDYTERLVSGASLEEHWHAGAADVIGQLQPDVVVLQQGPSSLPASQEHLRKWSEAFAGSIRDAGADPALLMVWPEEGRMEAFDAVSGSYRAAAEAVNGLLIPAGDAWRAAWQRDSDLALYGSDGFHPSSLGSLVAALAVYAVLFDADVETLPPSVAPGVPEERFAVVRAAVAEAVTSSRTP